MTTRMILAAMLAAVAVPAAAQQGTDEVQAAEPRETVVLRFTAEERPEIAMTRAAELFRQDHVARITISTDPRRAAGGVLVFDGLDAFTAWRRDGMERFFGPFGGEDAVTTTLQIFDPERLRKADPEATAGMEDIAIGYTNAGNDSGGDADIDAVTVICSGEDADCKPSN